MRAVLPRASSMPVPARPSSRARTTYKQQVDRHGSMELTLRGPWKLCRGCAQTARLFLQKGLQRLGASNSNGLSVEGGPCAVARLLAVNT